MAERDDLAKKMSELAEKGRELASQHAMVVAEFERLQERVKEIDRKQRENLN